MRTTTTKLSLIMPSLSTKTTLSTADEKTILDHIDYTKITKRDLPHLHCAINSISNKFLIKEVQNKILELSRPEWYESSKIRSRELRRLEVLILSFWLRYEMFIYVYVYVYTYTHIYTLIQNIKNQESYVLI